MDPESPTNFEDMTDEPIIQRSPFDELFVLELANNHWGSVDRGLRIISEFAQVVRFNNVRAAIKLQFRDPDHFIHQDYRDREDIRYIKKTMATVLQRDDYSRLVEAIRRAGCVPMATPFDEVSVDLCRELRLPMLKLASSDLNDWILIEKIASLRVPVIASSGGSTLKDLDDLVTFFCNRDIPLALNHCVSLYPSEDSELELNQIDFLRERYPGLTIGFSTHEYHDWTSSMLIAYAKGARTFERHIDIEADGVDVVAVLLAAPPGRRVVQGLPQGQGDVRCAGHREADPAPARDRVPRRTRARRLRASRHRGGRRHHGRRHLPRRPAAAGADVVPRADRRRAADHRRQTDRRSWCRTSAGPTAAGHGAALQIESRGLQA